jgi:ubiquinone/menaquinone biosynthesis C-methylase UbiE/acyl carrier protein
MHEQVKATVARISKLGGERILEIGCGTGLLLFELADKCRSYVGTDFSGAVLTQLESAVRERGWQHVELHQRQADDFEGFEPESFDVVVLNSVVQYFPGIDYCVRVLERACRVLRPGGYIFVGDVRNLKLLRMFHAGIELERASPRTTVRQLRERIEQGLKRERELVIEPAFFHALRNQSWNITGVTVQLKRGWSNNELTAFRYDVVIQVNGPARRIESYEELSWDQLGSVTSLQSYLREKSPSLLVVRGVLSARLNLVQHTLDELDAAKPDVTLGALGLEQLVAPAGVEPEQLWGLQNQLPYSIQIDWAKNGDSATYDVLCAAHSAEGSRTNSLSVIREDEDLRPWSAYANVLRNEPSRQDLAKTLRHSLANKLPEYMIPSTFIWLDALPLTPTGKLDRHALPAPNSVRNDPTDVYAAPKSDLERLIASVWSEVLGIEKISIDSNFFNIGGHSLLGMQVVARLSDSLNLNVPLRLMFETRSIRGLAEAISSLQTATKQPAIPRIVPAPRKDTSAIKLEQLTDEQVAALLNRLIARGEASG